MSNGIAMKTLIEKALKPVLILGGLGTSAAGLYAFFPQFAVANIAGLEFREDYTIFVQHWGIMVGLIGVMMVAAAFKPSWVMPVMIYAALEKAFMVYLVLSNVNESYSKGFRAGATPGSPPPRSGECAGDGAGRGGPRCFRQPRTGRRWAATRLAAAGWKCWAGAG